MSASTSSQPSTSNAIEEAFAEISNAEQEDELPSTSKLVTLKRRYSQTEVLDIASLSMIEQQRLLDSRILQVLELSDYEDDEDLYMNDELTTEDDRSSQMPPKIPPGMKSLPNRKYLSTKALVEELIKTDRPLTRIPRGRKENVYCILSHPNVPFSKSEKEMCFDDVGHWETTSDSNQHHQVMDDGDFRQIYIHQGKYCKRMRADDTIGRKYVILEPQPTAATLMTTNRIYQRLDYDPMKLRKISRITKFPGNFEAVMRHIATYDVFEYINKKFDCR